MQRLDWSNIQIFVAIARAGTLSGAAGQLGLTQPTVGRRLRAFELAIGTQLVHRLGVCLQLTKAGEVLRSIGEEMELAAMSAERVVIGRDLELAGHLAITAPEWLSVRVLTDVVAAFTKRHPAINIDLLASPRRMSLLQRDADVALRLARFTEAEVVQQCLGSVSFGLYASQEYIEERGYPDFDRLCQGHSIVALAHTRKQVADVAWMEDIASHARTSVRCNGRESQVRLAQAGAGLACLPRMLGDEAPKLVLLESPPPPIRKLWSGVHHETKDLPRVRIFLEFVAERLQEVIY